MTIATIVLVFITSAGIFGYLSNAYQGATLEFEKQSTELIAVEERIEQLEEDKEFLKEELSVAISELPDNYITAKRNLREQYNPQIVRVNEEILDYKKTRADLEIQLVSTGVDVGPAIYLARTFGTDIDTVVKFFIFILIFVFDPLAVMLVIAYNQALIERNKQSQGVESIIKKDASAFEEDNERMDIIGQNGNDGLHYDITDQDLIDDSDVEPREENDPRPYNPDLTPTAKGGIKTK
jgi:phage shock protein PspC (stress-responsive transcriptional regulator)